MILVLAGTREGRLAAGALEEAGFRVLAAAATTYGGKLLRGSMKGKVSSQRLDSVRMAEIIAGENISLVIDATHPFAVEVSANARRVCLQEGIPYLRLERESCPEGLGEGVTRVRDMREAAEETKKIAGNIFLTTGSSCLKEFVSFLGTERLVVRVLPLLESLQACFSLGVSPKNIIAAQGPFGVELNRAMFREYGAAAVVTKESGTVGGTKEKIEAARQLGIPVIIIVRPAVGCGRVCRTVKEAVTRAKEILKPPW